MPKKLYVGNLPRSYTASELQMLFTQYGTVQSAEVITDRMTGESRGFGFVQMESQEATDAAMAGLNGKDVEGRSLTVSEARERSERRGPPGEGGGGRGRGGRPGGSGRRW